jgi:iron complex transport system substrate-binding protein
MKSYLLISILLVAACKSTPKYTSNEPTATTTFDSLKYAKGFEICHRDSTLLISVFNPWQNASGTKYTYVLTTSQPAHVNSIKVPVQKVVCLSTTHIGFIDQLGCSATVVGVSNPGLVNNPALQKRIRDGEVADIGYDAALDYELILKLKPDVVFAYSVGNEIAPLQAKLADFGIPVIMVAEYLEESALAKAEWIKFFACFYQKDSLAEAFFNWEEHSYDSIKNAFRLDTTKPLILTGFPWKDVWYVPGSKSYMARLIEDAGGQYLFDSLPGRESQPFAIEYVCQQAIKAHIWINAGVCSRMIDITSSDARLQNLSPYKSRMVFNNNKRQTPDGGNDFFESGVVLPHLILKDLFTIFQNPNADESQLYYYQKIK